MIKNERQYRITRAHAEKFRSATREQESTPSDGRVHPVLRQAEIAALRSQLADLDQELADYEALRSGQRQVGELESFDDLPHAIIRRRIAAGLSQEELAGKLGLKPQQIQRYEATDYRSASLARVAEIVRALGVKTREGFFSVSEPFTVSTLVQRLETVGLSRKFVTRRLLPRPASPIERGEDETDQPQGVAVEAAEAISRIFGWSPDVLFGGRPLELAGTATATARFKLPAKARDSGLGAYALYAHYLALLVLEATPDVKPKTLPTSAKDVRQELKDRYGEISFDSVLKYVWSLGVPVLPLNDSGMFHGACWRVNSRNVIVLKQRTRSTARWLHDLLHEFYHSAHDPELEEHPVIEEGEMSPTRRDSREEQAASRFAGDVMLEGRAEELVEQCVMAAKGCVEQLKATVPKVAKRAGVRTDALANYLAFRLSLQGVNWWGAATNLQADETEALCTPRDLVFQHVAFNRLNPIDRDLLLRALEPLVLAFAGSPGSGKSTLSSEVARALGWDRASFGDYVRTVARSQGLDTSRDVLQELGASLVKQSPEDFCRAVLAHSNWQSGEPLVVDGVRHAEILRALRKLVAPLSVKLILVDVDQTTRHARLAERDETTAAELQSVEAHSTEKQVQTVLPGMADLRVPGDRSVGELVGGIAEWVHLGDGTERPCAS